MECNNCVNYKPGNNTLIISSEYKIGDTVWVMQYNKPVTKVIEKISINITESEYKIEYVLNDSCGSYPESWMKQHTFRTKQELLESL